MATDLLLSSVQLAFAAIITPAVAGLPGPVNVYAGKSSVDKIAPCVICAADGDPGESDPPHSGNYWVDFEIQIKSSAVTDPNAADPTPGNKTLVKTVFDAVHVDNLDALLNAAGQSLTVFPTGAFFKAPKGGWDEHDLWMDVLAGRLYCCGSVIT